MAIIFVVTMVYISHKNPFVYCLHLAEQKKSHMSVMYYNIFRRRQLYDRKNSLFYATDL